VTSVAQPHQPYAPQPHANQALHRIEGRKEPSPSPPPLHQQPLHLLHHPSPAGAATTSPATYFPLLPHSVGSVTPTIASVLSQSVARGPASAAAAARVRPSRFGPRSTLIHSRHRGRATCCCSHWRSPPRHPPTRLDSRRPDRRLLAGPTWPRACACSNPALDHPVYTADCRHADRPSPLSSARHRCTRGPNEWQLAGLQATHDSTHDDAADMNTSARRRNVSDPFPAGHNTI
jgi:hypothetical protein